jgi:hypothetical protein
VLRSIITNPMAVKRNCDAEHRAPQNAEQTLRAALIRNFHPSQAWSGQHSPELSKPKTSCSKVLAMRIFASKIK